MKLSDFQNSHYPAKKSIIALKFAVILFFFSMISHSSLAQQPDEDTLTMLTTRFEGAYGLDQNLIAGKQYFIAYPWAAGHAFLGEDIYSKGRIVVNQKEYKDVFLKYDICNQQIVLQFEDRFEGKNQIILNNFPVKEFELEDKLFRKYNFPETGPVFFQVIADGEITCLYHWKKSLLQDSKSLKSTYRYTPEKKGAFLCMNSNLYKVKGKKSFLKLFPDHTQRIKQFIQNNHIDIKNTTDAKMKKLIEFCATLNQETNK